MKLLRKFRNHLFSNLLSKIDIEFAYYIANKWDSAIDQVKAKRKINEALKLSMAVRDDNNKAIADYTIKRIAMLNEYYHKVYLNRKDENDI